MESWDWDSRVGNCEDEDAEDDVDEEVMGFILFEFVLVFFFIVPVLVKLLLGLELFEELLEEDCELVPLLPLKRRMLCLLFDLSKFTFTLVSRLSSVAPLPLIPVFPLTERKKIFGASGTRNGRNEPEEEIL